MGTLCGIRADELTRQQHTQNDCVKMILINTLLHANVLENHGQWWKKVAEQPCQETVANSGTMPHTNSQSTTHNWTPSN